MSDPEFDQEALDRWPELKQLSRRFITKHRIGSDDLETDAQQAKRRLKNKGVEAQYRNGSLGGAYKTAMDSVRNRSEKYHDYEQMSEDAAISGSLDIYADEATQRDPIDHHVVAVESEDEAVKAEIEKLLYQILRVDDCSWDIMRRLCSNGDAFFEVKFRKDFKGIYGVQRLDHKKMDRIETDGKLLGFKMRAVNFDPKRLSKQTSWGIQGMDDGKKTDVAFSPFRVIHWKLPDNSDSIYGRSILEAARRTWRQVRLMEDAVVIYRISRGAERRIFYINVGNYADDEAEGYIKSLMGKFKKKPFINPRTNEIDERANPLAWDEDFFIPIQDGKDGTRVEQLPGGQNLGDIEDLRYFRSKIDDELKIPTSYKSREGQYDAKAGLSQQDIRFSRTIERIQGAYIEGLNKLCYTHLMFRGFTLKEITGFTLKMTPPSALAELLRLDAIGAKLEVVASARGTEILPDIWCLTELMGFGEDEANELLQVMSQQRQQAAQMEAMAAGAAGGGGGGPTAIPGAAGDLAGGEGAPSSVDGIQDPMAEPMPGEEGAPMAPPPGQGGIELAGIRPLAGVATINEAYNAGVKVWLKRRKAKKQVKRRIATMNFEHMLGSGEMTGLQITVGNAVPLTEGLTSALAHADRLVAEHDKMVKTEHAKLVTEASR